MCFHENMLLKVGYVILKNDIKNNYIYDKINR